MDFNPYASSHGYCMPTYLQPFWVLPPKIKYAMCKFHEGCIEDHSRPKLSSDGTWVQYYHDERDPCHDPDCPTWKELLTSALEKRAPNFKGTGICQLSHTCPFEKTYGQCTRKICRYRHHADEPESSFEDSDSEHEPKPTLVMPPPPPGYDTLDMSKITFGFFSQESEVEPETVPEVEPETVSEPTLIMPTPPPGYDSLDMSKVTFGNFSPEPELETESEPEEDTEPKPEPEPLIEPEWKVCLRTTRNPIFNGIHMFSTCNNDFCHSDCLRKGCPHKHGSRACRFVHKCKRANCTYGHNCPFNQAGFQCPIKKPLDDVKVQCHQMHCDDDHKLPMPTPEEAMAILKLSEEQFWEPEPEPEPAPVMEKKTIEIKKNPEPVSEPDPESDWSDNEAIPLPESDDEDNVHKWLDDMPECWSEWE